jgi:ribose transport system permease protein
VLAVVAVLGALLMRSSYGRTLLAVGDNPEAAAFAGTSVWWTKTWAFMLSSLSATVAGILLVGYAGVHPSVGAGYEFQAITAVVLGGVVLGGGRGWVLSAAAGAFALELLFSFLNFQEVESTWRNTVQGVIIILAVAASARAWTLGRRPPSRSATPAPSPTTAHPGTETGEN